MLKLSEIALVAACTVLWGGTLGYLAHTVTRPAEAPAYWLIDGEPLAMFGTLAACEADRQSLGITSDEYFCAEVK